MLGSHARQVAFTAVTLTLLLSPGAVHAQISDTTPPSLTGVTFTPAAVDVTGAPSSVVVTVSSTDDLAGVSFVNAQFRSASGIRTLPTTTTLTLGRISGTPLNGVFRGTIQIPQYVEAGNWRLWLTLRDAANNFISLSPANIEALGFPTVLSVASVPDLVPPTVTSLSFEPAIIDVSSGSALVTATLGLADDVSGNDLTSSLEFRVTYRSPSGRQEQYATRHNFQRASGTDLAGTWNVSTEFPQHAEAGIWSLAALQVLDKAGNRVTLSAANLRALGLNPDLTVAATIDDTAPPEITGLAFTPSVIDTSAGPQRVTVTMRLTDDLTGISFEPDHQFVSFLHGIQFRSPSGIQNVNSPFFPSADSFRLTGGTVQNGVWTGAVVFPRYSEGGTWSANLVRIKDGVNNRFDRTTAQLIAAGLEAHVVVFRPSEESDGTIGPGGGSVDDSVFGERASITIPVGLLKTETSVAIDVLSNPPAVPTPAGFSGGTLFVNINLTPRPAMPLPSPGLSVTLPLSVFRTPGSPINLYRLDPGTGLLVPAVGVDRKNVVGVVGADGLSATFTGVARLSVVAGFFPTAVVGDIDGDGMVNCVDVGIARAAFGKRTGQSGFDARADVNRNGRIDVNDLAVVSRQLPAGVSCN